MIMGPDALQIEVVGDTGMAVIRHFAAPPARVYAAWAQAELFQRWWAPRSFGVGIVGCDMDVRTGGGYRLEFSDGSGSGPVFHGRYLEVVPGERLVWTNDEAGGGAVTTVDFAAAGDGTRLRYHDVHPSAAARDEAMGMADALREQFDQLDMLLAEDAVARA